MLDVLEWGRHNGFREQTVISPAAARYGAMFWWSLKKLVAS